MGYPPAAAPPNAQLAAPHRREQTNEYAALFVALIGEPSDIPGRIETLHSTDRRYSKRCLVEDEAPGYSGDPRQVGEGGGGGVVSVG